MAYDESRMESGITRPSEEGTMIAWIRHRVRCMISIWIWEEIGILVERAEEIAVNQGVDLTNRHDVFATLYSVVGEHIFLLRRWERRISVIPMHMGYPPKSNRH